ncbi:MAG: hypothetical protein IID45_12770 [Planctomycetes bacterium]|nr:hypothetical protein [Planctomycetota bacterium]
MSIEGMIAAIQVARENQIELGGNAQEFRHGSAARLQRIRDNHDDLKAATERTIQDCTFECSSRDELTEGVRDSLDCYFDYAKSGLEAGIILAGQVEELVAENISSSDRLIEAHERNAELLAAVNEYIKRNELGTTGG